MFTKEKSTIVKGVAIWMMMLHHCFLAGRFEAFGTSFYPFAQSQIVNLASYSKICVTLFAFVSGYGLYLSYRGFDAKIKTSRGADAPTPGQWTILRIIRSFSGYWLIVILSWIVCMIIDQRPIYVYGFDKTKIGGLWNAMIEFLGLSNFFGTPQLNGTWWYMTAAMAFIILTPIIFAGLEKLGSINVLGIIFILPRISGGFPGGTHFMSFLPAFVVGMIFAKEQLFEKWQKLWEPARKNFVLQIVKFLLMLFAVVACYKVVFKMSTDKFWEMKWGLLPCALIFFINDYISKIPGIKQILLLCGKHSMNIFLLHTFVRYYYCEAFTYSFSNFAVVIVVLLSISIILSVIVDLIARIIRYDALIKHIEKIFS